jgi:hypothetical protein
VKVSNSAVTCSSTSTYWTIKFSGDNFYWCNSAWWRQLDN